MLRHTNITFLNEMECATTLSIDFAFGFRSEYWVDAAFRCVLLIAQTSRIIVGKRGCSCRYSNSRIHLFFRPVFDSSRLASLAERLWESWVYTIHPRNSDFSLQCRRFGLSYFFTWSLGCCCFGSWSCVSSLLKVRTFRILHFDVTKEYLLEIVFGIDTLRDLRYRQLP